MIAVATPINAMANNDNMITRPTIDCADGAERRSNAKLRTERPFDWLLGRFGWSFGNAGSSLGSLPTAQQAREFKPSQTQPERRPGQLQIADNKSLHADSTANTIGLGTGCSRPD